MNQHYDALDEFNKNTSLREKIIAAHKSLKDLFPFISRIAITIYDPQTSLLKTYLDSSGGDVPLEHYQALLEDAPSLKAILDKGLPRVVNNMVSFENGTHEHTKRIGRQGYAASYTLPMYNNGVFFGFLFFNSDEKNVFTERVLREVDVYAHLISLTVVNELNVISTLAAAIKTTGHLSHLRDPETGSHLDRMSRYSRLIALKLAKKYDLNDAYIEHLFMFSPLHDVGKIAIPDEILLKPAALNADEQKVMESHATIGGNMIDELLENFSLENIEHIDMLRNIAESHHEAVDGSGYPCGIKGDAIPIEARIVAVADVFDALTSARPYKEAWSNEKAISMLKKLAGEKLDKDCVNALLESMEQVEQIQQRFIENTYG